MPGHAARRSHGIRHAIEVVTTSGVAAVLIVGLVAGTALAAKGGSGTTSTPGFTGPVMVVDQNANGSANYGDTIRFNVSASVSQPMVGLRCWQGAAFVYDAYGSYFDSWMSDGNFVLSSSYWVPTASATCTARLFNYDRRGRERVLSTLSFDVAP